MAAGGKEGEGGRGGGWLDCLDENATVKMEFFIDGETIATITGAIGQHELHVIGEPRYMRIHKVSWNGYQGPAKAVLEGILDRGCLMLGRSGELYLTGWVDEQGRTRDLPPFSFRIWPM